MKATYKFLFLAIFFSLFSVVPALATVSLTFVSPSPGADATITTRLHAEINVTSNETIAANASTIWIWYNTSGANVNFTVANSNVIIANRSNGINYTWVNLTNLAEGVHRVLIQVYSNESSSTVIESRNFTVDLVPTLRFINNTLTTTVVQVGNLSKVDALRVNITLNDGAALGVNVTFIMPYGMANQTPCNGKSQFARLNTTHVLCERNVGNLANGTTTAVEINVTANISAYTQYGVQVFSFSVNCTDGGGAGGLCTQNTSFALISAVNSIRNPRPEAVNPSETNAALLFTNWNQTDMGYKVMVPIFTFDPNLGRPILANNTFGEVLFFDKSFFEAPTFMRLWTYNITFRIIYTGAENGTNFTVRSPINNSNPAFATQSLIPIFVRTETVFEFESNVTHNFTIGVPDSSSFTVYWNGTNYTQSALLASNGINVTFAGTDASVALLLVGIPNDTVAKTLNNTDISVLFTLVNLTACGTAPCSTSPIFVNSQSLSGWTFDSPPKFGDTLNISYVINVTNAFTNYTVNNLSISIMQPMNVTMVGATTQQFNMTRMDKIKISVFNGSAFIENLSVIRRESNFSFSDVHGPSQSNITVYITTFDVLLTNSTAGQNILSGWEPNANATVVVNFTAEMSFPVLSESAVPSGATNASHEYNATLNAPQRAPLNFTAKLPGLDSSATDVNITIDGVQIAASNLTIGSLIIKDVQAGQHVVTVKYSVPAAAAAAAAPAAGGGGGGAVAPTGPKVSSILATALPEKENKLIIDTKDLDVKEVVFEVTETLKDVKFIITEVDKPAAVAAPSGTAYQYIDIKVENLPQEKLKSAKIKFSVLKSWLRNNNASADNVVLLRYTTAWDKLKTIKVDESSSEVFYVAETPGFSLFVTVVEVGALAPPAATPTPAETPAATPTPPAATPAPTLAPERGISIFVWLSLLAVVILTAGYLLTKGKKKARPKEHAK